MKNILLVTSISLVLFYGYYRIEFSDNPSPTLTSTPTPTPAPGKPPK